MAKVCEFYYTKLYKTRQELYDSMADNLELKGKYNTLQGSYDKPFELYQQTIERNDNLEKLMPRTNFSKMKI